MQIIINIRLNINAGMSYEEIQKFFLMGKNTICNVNLYFIYHLIVYKFLLDMVRICNVHLYFTGFLCVRAIDTITGAPKPISSIWHRNTTNQVRKRNKNVSTGSPKEL